MINDNIFDEDSYEHFLCWLQKIYIAYRDTSNLFIKRDIKTDLIHALSYASYYIARCTEDKEEVRIFCDCVVYSQCEDCDCKWISSFCPKKELLKYIKDLSDELV